MQICKILQFLDVMHKVPVSWDKHEPLFAESMQTTIAAMFPNVLTNGWIISVRGGSYRAKEVKIEKKKNGDKLVMKMEAPVASRLRSSTSLTPPTRLRPRPASAATTTSRKVPTKKT